MNHPKTKTFLAAACTALLFAFSFQPSGSGAPKSRELNQKKELSKPTQLHNARNTEEYFFSTGPSRSVQIGETILQRGGSAVDAALTSALARIVYDMGRIVSFAGIFMMVYYEASTGETHSLNACFKTVQDELYPQTIPTHGIPNARAVLVPGFMAGIQAAHDRFGRLPWAEIFEPAIDLAENGFAITGSQIEIIKENWNVLGILPETRDVFLKHPYGLFRGYQAGDIFTQPALAHTLREVASRGAGYMYTGEWGQKFADTIRREGGHMSRRDMEDYEPARAEPAKTTYLDYELNALGYPSLGAMNIVLAVNLMECAKLAEFDHCSRAAAALLVAAWLTYVVDNIREVIPVPGEAFS